jgi:hypothetical protein
VKPALQVLKCLRSVKNDLYSAKCTYPLVETTEAYRVAMSREVVRK